jgi:hypothetical protein
MSEWIIQKLDHMSNEVFFSQPFSFFDLSTRRRKKVANLFEKYIVEESLGSLVAHAPSL